MADINSSQPNNNVPIALERAAVVPISQDEVLNQYLRNLTTANKKENLSFYRGIITGIYDDKNEDYRVNDIFYDFGAEQDKNNNTNSSNNDKKILLVHVPSFITNNKISATRSSFDNFNKLRVVYNGTEQVQVGYIVFLEFEDKANLLKPRVKEIIKTESSFLDKNTKISTIAFLPQENNIVDINPPQTPEQIFEKEITVPGGGYETALKAIDKIFQADFISTFISFLEFTDNKEFGDLSKISIQLLNLAVNEELLNYINSSIPTTNIKIIPDNSSTKKDYLIYGYVDVICENVSKVVALRNKFFQYIKVYTSSSYYHTINFNNFNNEFSLDVNLNLVNKTTKSLKNYLDIQTKGYGGNFLNESLPKNSAPAIITDNIA